MNQSPWANYHSLNMKHNIKLTPYSDESRTSTLKHAFTDEEWKAMTTTQRKNWCKKRKKEHTAK